MDKYSYLCLATTMLALIQHGAVAQPSVGKGTGGGSAATNGLLDARSREIKLQFKNDPDVAHAASALAKYLKNSDPLKQTILSPCPAPPAPAPAGAGSGRVIKIGTRDGWESIMPSEIGKVLPQLVDSRELSNAQQTVLTKVVVPEFAKAGDDGKFSTIVRPTCPSPIPAPAGHQPASSAFPFSK